MTQLAINFDATEVPVVVPAATEQPGGDWHAPAILAPDGTGRQIANQIVRLLENNFHYFDSYHNAFRTCVELCDYTLHRYEQGMEEKYMETVGRMKPKAIQCAAEVFSHLQRMYFDYVVDDILGMAYMDLASHGQKQWMGQFFTPIGVCEMMAAMSLGDVHDQIAKAKTEGRRITVCEPCIGSGAMVLGAKRHIMRTAGLGGLDHFRFFGQDTDQMCVSMARVQMTLTDYRYMANFFIAFAGEVR